MGGCALTMCAVGTAADQVATEVHEESGQQAEVVAQVTDEMEWTLVEDEYGFKTLEAVVTNDTDQLLIMLNLI